ncbi:MAG: hypothetical protein LW636_06440 [Planctomycetaceae bacterium]|nr:hypothetical protein [Planctomycetaceae bacterium]
MKLTLYSAPATPTPSQFTRPVRSVVPAHGMTTKPMIAGATMNPGARKKSALSTPFGL